MNMRLLKNVSKVAALVCIAVLFSAVSMFAAPKNMRPSYVANQYIIKVKAGTPYSAVVKQVKSLGGSIISKVALPDSYLIKMSGKAPNLTKKTNWVISSVQPNYYYYKSDIPNDEFFNDLWGMRAINAPAAWDTVKGSANVTVAVTDTGVAFDHPDLIGRCLPGHDSVTTGADAYDLEGHGTHVSGTIAAQGNNGIGVVGVCWDNVKILPVRVLNELGSGRTDWIVDGLRWAADNGANIVNMSLGSRFPDDSIHSAIVDCTKKGIAVVAAAGNDSGSSTGFPAAYPECVAVSATNKEDQISYYSSYGPGNEVDIAAPGGEQIFTNDPNGILSTVVEYTRDANGVITGKNLTYAYYQGTSMAAPHVSGSLALLMSAGFTATDAKNIMFKSARKPVGFNPIKYGAGIVDLNAALSKSRFQILSPVSGTTVDTRPTFTVSMFGINKDSIKVYLDYTDVDNDGIPDNINAETPIVDAANIDAFYDANTGLLSFEWPLPGFNPLTSGSHKVYAQANTILGDELKEDFSKFTVVPMTVKTGTYIIAFPYVIAPEIVKPSDILPGSTYTGMGIGRAKLTRWVAAPVITGNPIQIGYVTYTPGESNLSWELSTTSPDGVNTIQVNGMAYFLNNLFGDPIPQSTPIAGSGYWLTLSENTPINDQYETVGIVSDIDLTRGVTVQGFKGWNMIGNPFTYDIGWQNVMITYRGQSKSMKDADAAGWLNATLYGFDSSESKEYIRLTERDTMRPYRGYWLHLLKGSDTDPIKITLYP